MLHPNSFRNVDGFVVLFDVSGDKQELGDVNDWLDLIKDFSVKDKPNIIIVGNKSDQPRKVNKELVERFVREKKCPYTETSALNGTNVCNAFNCLLLEVMGLPEEARKILNPDIVDPDHSDPSPPPSKPWYKFW